MKRSIIILLVTVLAFAAAPFSNARAEGAIGVKVGITASDWWGDDAGGPDMKNGLLGGVFFSYMMRTKFLLFESFGIQPEILYHRKGAKEIYMGMEMTWNLDYLEIPILAKVEIPPRSSFSRGFLLIGPAFALNLDSTIKVEYLGESAEADAGDITSSMDVGFVLGLNANFDIKSIDLVVDLRYTLGLMTIDESGNDSVRNTALSLLVGVAYPFGGGE